MSIHLRVDRKPQHKHGGIFPSSLHKWDEVQLLCISGRTFDEEEGVIKEKYQMRNTGYNTGLSMWRSVWARMLAKP